MHLWDRWNSWKRKKWDTVCGCMLPLWRCVCVRLAPRFPFYHHFKLFPSYRWMRHGVAFIQLFDLIVYRKPYDLLEVLRLYLSRGQCKRFLIIIANTAVYDQMTLKDSLCVSCTCLSVVGKQHPLWLTTSRVSPCRMTSRRMFMYCIKHACNITSYTQQWVRH